MCFIDQSNNSQTNDFFQHFRFNIEKIIIMIDQCSFFVQKNLNICQITMKLFNKYDDIDE